MITGYENIFQSVGDPHEGGSPAEAGHDDQRHPKKKPKAAAVNAKQLNAARNAKSSYASAVVTALTIQGSIGNGDDWACASSMI